MKHMEHDLAIDEAVWSMTDEEYDDWVEFSRGIWDDATSTVE